MARKKARDHKRQTKIDFSPASQPSRATRSSAAPIAGASQKPQKPIKGSPGRASKKTYQESTSEDELAQETERDLRIGMFNDRNNHSSGSSSSEEEQQVEKQPKSKSKKRRREATPSESEDESTVVVILRKRQRHTIKVETESSEEDKKRKKKKKQAKSEPAPRSTRRGVAKKASTPDEEEEDQQDDHTPPRSIRRKLKRRRPAPDDEDEDEDEIHGVNKDSASDAEDSGGANDTRDNKEQEELKEDLAFLRSSPVADSCRSTSTMLRNKRQEALEALKRRRAGTTEASSATPVRRKTVVIDSDSDFDSELEIIKEEEDSDAEASDQDNSEDEQETNAFDMFQEDQDDEQFIDDTDNIIGEPVANDDLDELRLTLSLSRAKTKDLFRHAVEWMVMKKIHPGFEATKNIYTVTFRKLDDEVKGLAGSKYTSAAWTADFTRAIRARPDLMITDLSASERAVMSPHCEACNRTNHTASSEVLFQGQPYNPDTLEPVSTDSDSDSDSSSSSALSSDSETLPNGEKPTYNFQKERIPPESHRFPVGSTCKANAQVAHTLYHWRYHLYQWVKDYLKAEGHLTAEKLVKRDGWSDRKRYKAARKIVKRMEEKGQIRELYHSYKNQITAAVEADNRFENGWGRRGR